MTNDTEDLQDTYPGAGTFKFGDSAELCQRLISLVRQGKKTATCAALADFEGAPEAMPVVGRCDIAANWDGTPALVIRTTKVQEIRYCDVTEEMALAEGENDTLLGWRKDHKAYFRNNTICRLINPSKCEIGLRSNKYLANMILRVMNYR